MRPLGSGRPGFARRSVGREPVPPSLSPLALVPTAFQLGVEWETLRIASLLPGEAAPRPLALMDLRTLCKLKIAL